MPTYLRAEAYYEDIYDRGTLEECRRIERTFAANRQSLLETDVVGTTAAGRSHMLNVLHELRLYYTTGDRWLAKPEAIRCMMERDRARDTALVNVRPPTATCPQCSKRLDLILRDFATSLETEPIVFYFRCPLCAVTKTLREDGAEHRQPTPSCSRCQAAVVTTYEREGRRVSTTDTCTSCGHVEVSVLDLDQPFANLDAVITKDRARFCLSTKEGEQYREHKADMVNIRSMLKEWDDKENNNELYAAIAKVKKLTTAQLEKYLVPRLEKAQYRRLDLRTPQTTMRMFTVAFTVEDTADREPYVSRKALEKMLNTTLAGTNWRLTTDGASYQLGILNGRLRGFESEDDLLELVRSGLKKSDRGGHRQEGAEPVNRNETASSRV